MILYAVTVNDSKLMGLFKDKVKADAMADSFIYGLVNEIETDIFDDLPIMAQKTLEDDTK